MQYLVPSPYGACDNVGEFLVQWPATSRYVSSPHEGGEDTVIAAPASHLISG
jgi:hypothetical protein